MPDSSLTIPIPANFSFDYNARYPEAVREISAWLADGSLKRKYQIVEGLDKAPEAMSMLYTGGNTGKL